MAKRLSNKEKFNRLKSVVQYQHFGIHSYGLLHDIADAFGWDDINTGMKLHYIWRRVCYMARTLIKAGYPLKEYRIKCCSWSPRESWHPMFRIEKEL